MAKSDRQANINVRVSEQEKAELLDAAKRAGMTLSEFARGRLLGAPEPTPRVAIEGETVDLAGLIVAKYGWAVEQARRLIAQGSVKIDGLDGVWKEPQVPVQFKDRILVGREPSTAEKARRRELRELRQRVADEAGVAIGFVRPDGTIEQGAKPLSEEALRLRAEYAKATSGR